MPMEEKRLVIWTNDGSLQRHSRNLFLMKRGQFGQVKSKHLFHVSCGLIWNWLAMEIQRKSFLFRLKFQILAVFNFVFLSSILCWILSEYILLFPYWVSGKFRLVPNASRGKYYFELSSRQWSKLHFFTNPRYKSNQTRGILAMQA